MYYNDYEDYMRNALGYSNANESTYQRYDDNCCGMSYNNANYNGMNYNNMNYDNIPYNDMSVNQFQNRNDSATIERMYPEIYRVINPMVCRMCDNNSQPVTEYLVEQMTDDIYDNVVNRVEIQNVINLNIGTREADVEVEDCCDNRSDNVAVSNRSSSNSSNNNTKENSASSKIANSVKSEEDRESRSPQSQPRRRNRLLRDLIRILILNRLLRRRPNRPPFRPGQRPGMPGNNRPPMPRMDEFYRGNNYVPYA